MMLNNYQKLQQLKILRNRLTSEYDIPKKEALDFAIKVVEKEINKGVVDNLCDTMQNVAEMTKIYEDWIEKEKKRCSRRTEDGTLVINRERLAQSASPISVLHELLSPLGFNETQVKNLLTVKGFHSNRQKGAYEMQLPGGETVMIEVKWKELRIMHNS